MQIHRSNEQWAKAIHAKISSVLEDSGSDEQQLKPLAPLADITSPDDPCFAQAIDHTLLAPDATTAQIDRLCDEAHRFNFKVKTANATLDMLKIKNLHLLVLLRKRLKRPSSIRTHGPNKLKLPNLLRRRFPPGRILIQIKSLRSNTSHRRRCPRNRHGHLPRRTQIFQFRGGVYGYIYDCAGCSSVSCEGYY